MYAAPDGRRAKVTTVIRAGAAERPTVELRAVSPPGAPMSECVTYQGLGEALDRSPNSGDESSVRDVRAVARLHERGDR